MSLHTADEVAGRVARMGQAGHAHDCVTDPMDGYCANADDAAKAWGSPDSPETKAAYILGCSLIHAAHVLADPLAKAFAQPGAHPSAAWVRDGLESIATATQRLATSVAILADATASIATAIINQGDAVSAAIDVHSESIDRLADAIETRAP